MSSAKRPPLLYCGHCKAWTEAKELIAGDFCPKCDRIMRTAHDRPDNLEAIRRGMGSNDFGRGGGWRRKKGCWK